MIHSPMMLIPVLSLTMVLMTMMSRQQHLLPTLLCLESLMLFMIYLLPSMSNKMLMMMNPLMIIILSMSVSSASMGLSLLVMTSRNSGNDSTLHPTSFSC